MNHDNEHEYNAGSGGSAYRFVPEGNEERPAPGFFQPAPHFESGAPLDGTANIPPVAPADVPPAAVPPVTPPVGTPPVAPPVGTPPVTPYAAPSAARTTVPPVAPAGGAAKKPGKAKKSKGRHGVAIVIIVLVVALCSSLFGGVCGGLLTMLLDIDLDYSGQGGANNGNPSGGSTTVQNGNREDVNLDEIEVDTSKAQTAAQIYHNNVASTVSINATVKSSFLGHETTSTSSGSGFVYSASDSTGYIVTNHHVVEGSSSLSVILYDGTTLDATLLASDEANDIAVLQVQASGLKPVILGDSDKLNVGDTVLAIGNPLGELAFSLTSGIVSGLDRQVEMSNGITMSLIQTECPINSGNSGGALFNEYGEVVGVVNAKYSSNFLFGASIDNIGFAIPLNSVAGIIETIIKTGSYAKPYIGVSVTDATGSVKGAQITAIEAGSPAATAGLQIGDIVTKVGDTEITAYTQLGNAISKSAVGDVLKLTVYRGDAYTEVSVTVGEKK